jgi:hypothetical protein
MNTKKTLAIFMCMLVIALIPVAAGATTKQTQDPQTSAIGGTFIRGIVLGYHEINLGHDVSFRCLWVHYRTHDLAHQQSGFFHMFQKLTLDNTHVAMSLGRGRVSYIMGWYDGSF